MDNVSSLQMFLMLNKHRFDLLSLILSNRRLEPQIYPAQPRAYLSSTIFQLHTYFTKYVFLCVRAFMPFACVRVHSYTHIQRKLVCQAYILFSVGYRLSWLFNNIIFLQFLCISCSFSRILNFLNSATVLLELHSLMFKLM